ncbi:MAG TPA: hypothetical protein VFY38_05675 [Pseudonocardia sp.]|nr:hypothetical protein [Pseudonocardia sp.]
MTDNQDWDALAAALRRHVRDIPPAAAAPLLARLIDHDPRLLDLMLDAYGIGYYTAVGERSERELVDDALDERVRWPDITVLTVETRHRKDGGGKVALGLDGHLFLSIVDWDDDEQLARARVETETRLRRKLGLAAAPEPLPRAESVERDPAGEDGRWVRSVVVPDDHADQPVAIFTYWLVGGSAPRVWQPPTDFTGDYPAGYTTRHLIVDRPAELPGELRTDTLKWGPGEWRPDTRASAFEPVEAE